MNIDQIIQNIGWTLIHSLWQVPVIFVVALVIAKMLKTSAPNVRYAVWICALLLVPVLSIVTFIVMDGGESGAVVHTGVSPVAFSLSTSLSSIQTTAVYRSVTAIAGWIDVNLYMVIRAWLIGSAFFLVRMLAGILYIYFLRRNAQRVLGNWEERINMTARTMQIMKPVRVAVGPVSAPLVIGYLKPLVLFPAGMLAGLAPEQVEAIMIHELAHVRRHDFVVNLFQCLLESIFFFNPFVWIISSMARLEREHCCDDLVISHGIEPIVYVKTLAEVEGAHPAGHLAMGLLGQKHQLLNRMKRVMEKSLVKKGFTPAKVLPFALVLVGLACASWLSINNDTSADFMPTDKQYAVPTDTSITITEYNIDDRNDDKAGHATTQVYAFEYSPDVSAAPPSDPRSFGPFPGMPAFPGDSIPGFLYVPGGDWTEFEKEFSDKFQGEFGEFFDKHREQFEKMMTELRREHDAIGPFAYPQVYNLGEEELKALERQMASFSPMLENFENMMPAISEDVLIMQEHARELSHQALAESDLARTQADIARMQAQMARDHERMMLNQEENLRAYEQEMINQLRTDGYLDKDEKVNELHISNDEITVNGKKVKEKDQKKYRQIIDRFNEGWHTPRRPE